MPSLVVAVALGGVLPMRGAVVSRQRRWNQGFGQGKAQGTGFGFGDGKGKGHFWEVNSKGWRGGEAPDAGKAQYWRPPKQKARAKERPDSGAYVVMRRMSEIERETADSNVNFRGIREEQETLKHAIRECGIKVVNVEADEDSPFSSRIGRYAHGMPASLLMAHHPDGLAPKAHRQIQKVLDEHKIFLPPLTLKARNRALSFDLRDLVVVQGVHIAGAREDTHQDVFRNLDNIVNPKVHRVMSEVEEGTEYGRLKVIDCSSRGINTPLSRAMECIDGYNLVIDASNPAAVLAIDQSGLKLTGMPVINGPPFITECMWLDTSQMGGRNTILVPEGFPEVEQFVRELALKRANVIVTPFHEHMKMGIRFRELLLFLKPLYEGAGGMEGVHLGGRRRNFYEEQEWKTEMKTDSMEAGHWNRKMNIGQPTNPFDWHGWLVPPEDHPWVKQRRKDEQTWHENFDSDLGREVNVVDQFMRYQGMQDLPGLDHNSTRAAPANAEEAKKKGGLHWSKRRTPWKGDGGHL